MRRCPSDLSDQTFRSGLMWRLDTRSVLLAMVVVAFPLQILIAPHAGFCADLK